MSTILLNVNIGDRLEGFWYYVTKEDFGKAFETLFYMESSADGWDNIILWIFLLAACAAAYLAAYVHKAQEKTVERISKRYHKVKTTPEEKGVAKPFIEYTQELLMVISTRRPAATLLLVSMILHFLNGFFFFSEEEDVVGYYLISHIITIIVYIIGSIHVDENNDDNNNASNTQGN